MTLLTTDKPKHGCPFDFIRTPSLTVPPPNRSVAASGGGFRRERVVPAMRTVIPLALGCLLAGCAVGPGYLKPDLTLGPFHNAERVTARGAGQPAPPLDQWWLGFHDPELTKIIQRALAQNFDIKASLERVAQARAAARTAGARLLPAFDASTQVLAERQSLESPIGSIAQTLPGYDRNAELYDVGASASWEIDLFGGLRHTPL